MSIQFRRYRAISLMCGIPAFALSGMMLYSPSFAGTLTRGMLVIFVVGAAVGVIGMVTAKR